MASFQILINRTKITNGKILSFAESQYNPRIIYNHKIGDLYTIIAVDPDAPSKDNPIYKYWLHLLIINNNEKIVGYELPTPPPGSGKHRYYFYLLKQMDKLDKNNLGLNIKDNKIERPKFNLETFIQNHNLELIDSVYFQTEQNMDTTI